MSKEVQKKEDQEVVEKTCFIITPIGDEKSPIRRHIDGVIESAIEPVLKEFKYKLDVSHKSYNSGSIKSEIIKSIFESDLVIANLTYQNPNVMYEVAIRHCVAKPIIHISENINEIPFDINSHRTFDYVNDMHGVEALKEKIRKAITDIESSTDISNPVIDSLKTTKIIDLPNQETSYGDAISEILDTVKEFGARLNNMELKTSKPVTIANRSGSRIIAINGIDVDNNKEEEELESIYKSNITSGKVIINNKRSK